MKWTAKDEADLEALTKRKSYVMEQHQAKLLEVLAKVAAPKFTEEERLFAAIHHADELRDALLPFDSGLRVAK